MGTNTEEFFCGLSERMWKENDLSDVTYALCVGNMEFRQSFLDFFFRGENLCASDVDISREWVDNDGNRPDFCVRKSDGRYLFVEVKLWDGNLHFDSYRDGLKNLNNCEACVAAKDLAYIAAYEINKESVVGCDSVHTWYEFYNGLKSLSFLNDDTIRGYCAFVYAVAGLQSKAQADFDIKKYTTFKASDFVQVRQFMESLDKTVDAAKDKDVEAYTGSSRCIRSGCRMGRFFEVKNFKADNSVWGWIGANYNALVSADDKSKGQESSGPEICVWFENRTGWGKLVCEKFKDSPMGSKPTDDTWYYKAEGGHLYFYMLDSDKDISTFFNRVLDKIRSGDRNSSKLENSDVKKEYSPLLAMRQFPLCIERSFLNVEDGGYMITAIDASGDSEDPYNHCGRYFTVERRDVQTAGCGKKQQLNGWVGVLFGENEKATERPRIELQFLQENGRYACEARIGENSCGMARIAQEFKEKLKECCEKKFAQQ